MQKKFKDLIKSKRKAKGWTQKFISELLNVPYQTWSNWERGKCEPAKSHQAGILALMSDPWKNWFKEEE